MGTQAVNVLVTINFITLISVLGFGFRIVRFLSRIELEHEMMWRDYTTRVGHTHRRIEDE